MKNTFFIYVLFILFGSSSIEAALSSDTLFAGNKSQEEPKILINNRILARVNGKPISTYDVAKKMDLSFYRQYPEYMSSNAARAQYYDLSWKYVLEDMIDKELILADAQENKIELSSGDIRQEMESAFGPNIIVTLDKAGMTFEEATKTTQQDLIIRRMITARVHAKAIRQVTPAKVKRAYDEFIRDPANARLSQWAYRIITISERTLEKTAIVAKTAHQMLMDGIAPDQLMQQLKEMKISGRKGKVTISKVVKQNEKEISDDYRKILSTLDPGMYSEPFVHRSRVNNTTVYRILIVEEKIPGEMLSFKEMESNLKNNLLDDAIEKETVAYLQKLRQHYHIQNSELASWIPADYQPFVLK